jgi:uncharacterized membrane protein (UPF0136 family)
VIQLRLTLLDVLQMQKRQLDTPRKSASNLSEALPTYGMAAATTLMGVRGFRATKSIPSLAAGIGFGTLFGVSGYLIQDPATTGSGRTIALGTETTPLLDVSFS